MEFYASSNQYKCVHTATFTPTDAVVDSPLIEPPIVTAPSSVIAVTNKLVASYWYQMVEPVHVPPDAGTNTYSSYDVTYSTEPEVSGGTTSFPQVVKSFSTNIVQQYGSTAYAVLKWDGTNGFQFK